MSVSSIGGCGTAGPPLSFGLFVTAHTENTHTLLNLTYILYKHRVQQKYTHSEKHRTIFFIHFVWISNIDTHTGLEYCSHQWRTLLRELACRGFFCIITDLLSFSPTTVLKPLCVCVTTFIWHSLAHLHWSWFWAEQTVIRGRCKITMVTKQKWQLVDVFCGTNLMAGPRHEPRPTLTPAAVWVSGCDGGKHC